MADICRRRRAATLVLALHSRFDLPVHLHTQDTAGGQLATLLSAINDGVDAVDVASAPMSGTTSQPSMSALIATTDGIRASERASFQAVCDLEPYWEGVGQLDAPFESGLASPTGRVSAHKIPSGQRQPAPAGDRAGPGRQVRERCTPRPTRSSEKS
jgi:pyruvate carboxylase